MVSILVICGPTASGKTDLAHQLALKHNGEIINCDSMQIYQQIPIITASPSFELTDALPYHLYNFQNISDEFSVIKYVEMAAAKVKDVINNNKLPIIVGGTGMYINALLYGYNDMPEISHATRQHARDLHAQYGQEKFFELLTKLDSKVAIKLNSNDAQRAIRAFEVFAETGKSIIHFQDEKNVLPLIDFDFEIVFLHPERNLLHNFCNQRLVNIFANGAIDEAKNILENFNNLRSSAASAIGLPELISYLNGVIDYDVALDLAQKRTRQYAKRQITWFKHQLKEKTTFEYSTVEEYNQLKIVLKYHNFNSKLL